jgi:hypothetical protein
VTLPKIAQLEFPASDLAQQAVDTTVHKTLDWDFEDGDFRLKDGKTVELTGIEYLKIWIQKSLRTVINSLIYAGTDYGSGHHSLIGKNFHPDYSRSEYERLIREALLTNEAISRVDNFTFSQDGARLTIEFEVTSIYGQATEGVTV